MHYKVVKDNNVYQKYITVFKQLVILFVFFLVKLIKGGLSWDVSTPPGELWGTFLYKIPYCILKLR